MVIRNFNLMDSSEIQIFVEGEEDNIFYNWLLFDIINKNFRNGIRIESCGGKGCQKIIASMARGRKKFIITDRDYQFLGKSNYPTHTEEILKAAASNSLTKVKEEKELTIIQLFPTELENLFFLIALEKEFEKLKEFIEEKREKLIAFTLLRCATSLCKKAKKELDISIKSCNEKEVLRNLLNGNIFLSEDQRNRLRYFKNLLVGLELKELCFLIAGKETRKLLEKTPGNPVGKVLKNLGFNINQPNIPRSDKDAYKKGSSEILDKLRTEILEILGGS